MSIFTRLFAAALVAVAVPVAGASAQTLYDNFENVRLVNYSFTSGVLSPNTPNPGSNAVNSSPTCAKYVRNAAEQFDVIQIRPIAAPNKLADVAAYAAGTKKMTLKFWSPAVGVALQAVLQNGAKAGTGYPNGNFGGTLDVKTTVANAWELLTFTYTAGTSDPTVKSTDVDQIVLLISPNTNTGGTYYFDDLTGPELLTGTAPVVTDQLYDNYEGTRAIGYSYAKTSGGIKLDTLNPAVGAGNPSARVMRYTRSTQQYDALVVHPTGAPLADVAPFLTSAKQMTMKVYSPAPGITFQVTLQDSTVAGPSNYPAGRHSEYLATTTATNAWETLVFSYANRPSAAVSNTSINEIVLLIAPNTTARRRVYLDDWTGPRKTNFVPTSVRAATSAAALLEPVYPNPATGRALLPVQLRKAATISLSVHDALGRRVATPLPAGRHPAGSFVVEVPTTGFAPGLYLLRFEVDGVVLTQRLSVR
ncbi:T9SS type A sorting domain-containing protein [Hymenobacter rubripertinctus]|uniref:T9SS C-terminal target domain-containing protein n=1 Tax=Hymenobacter rubripertinctus TaxID=2029981 RepID=A0A418R882_9BACT|nr:T9SS type A sorting domain-containing protein [Hymenobacter rubripertinctus]RIY13738.1 T9SS C-terminal target domain-containing protein [Hymenobacter rubripertinctus]